MKILLYNIKFNKVFSVSDVLRIDNFHSKDVLLTSDRNELHLADVVVFNLPQLGFNLRALPKRAGQIWVGWNLECEKNYPFLLSEELKSLIDVWMTYHPGSDVPIPYLNDEFPERIKNAPPSSGLKDVCIFISSPVNNSRRLEYLTELMKHINIDSYGKFLHNTDLQGDSGYKVKQKVLSEYKFTIAFENAIYEDYVTEKFYDPLLSGSVPVYLGAPNIAEFTPGRNAFVDVRNFPNPKDLAVKLKLLCANEQLLREFYRWKNEALNDRFTEIANKQNRNPFERLINYCITNKI